MNEMVDTIVCIIFGIGILILCLINFGFGYVKGEDNLIQKLCNQQQYDFCEVIEHKPEYRIKEKQDD